MFDSVLVANRGEIACRIFRTLRRLGISGVAVFSDADAGARHVLEADSALRIGPAPARESYLSIAAVIDAALASDAQAIHPGYGFLAESPEFATACFDAGITWIGPPAAAIASMGDKISAKNLVAARGVPVVPGRATPGMDDDELAAAAHEIGWPVLVKPAAGGGGKGMHVVAVDSELRPTLARARREAAAAFGDDSLFVERYLSTPRHVEVQVLADSHGRVIHLGERECSLQRRHQKVVEEAPSPLLSPSLRARIGAAACETARSVGYEGVGTVEFIVSATSPDEFFFMEMNTRLQVEHPVTEMVTGIDLVEAQLRVAAGEPLWLEQEAIVLSGHAIEARIYAEDPALGFLPTAGTVGLLHEPVGEGVRVDSGLLSKSPIVTEYDPMLAKVIGHGRDRDEALHRLHGALQSTVVLGVVTNTDFLADLLLTADVVEGRIDTGLIERLPVATWRPPTSAYIAAVMHAMSLGPRGDHLWGRRDGWRLAGVRARRSWRFRDGERVVDVSVTGDTEAATVVIGAAEPVAASISESGSDWADIRLPNRSLHASVLHEPDAIWVHVDGRTWRLVAAPAARLRPDLTPPSGGAVLSPMPGTVVSVAVVDGQSVSAGDPVVIVEAMKMEHTVIAPIDGLVVTVTVQPGDSVAKDQELARVEAAADTSS